MNDLPLAPPGLIVNSMKGDPDEYRAAGFLAWDGKWEGLQAGLIGVPFDGASVVRTGARHGPDAVRQAFMYYTNFSSLDGRAMTGFRAADLGDVKVTLTDMASTFDNISATARGLVARGIVPLTIGGDHWITYPLLKGLTDALLTWQTEQLQEIATRRDEYTVYVRPELVVEIALDGAQVSTRYAGGVALRFARVRAYRPDKAAADAGTIDAVRALLAP